jgi:hypothetical protein
MAGQSSLTTSRLAALSLSPSRIAQLGVKHEAREGLSSGDENGSSTREPKRTSKAGESVVSGRKGDEEGGKHEGLMARPDLSRRSSTLESLSDEGDDDDDDDVAEGRAAKQGEGNEEGRSDEERSIGQGIPTIRTEPPQGSSPESSPPKPSPPRPVITTAAQSDARPGPSRDRSPPPSYEHAILPSTLQQSSSPPSPGGQTRRPMSATARGKRRDVGEENRQGHDSGREGGTLAPRSGSERGEPMLELLPNSDTDEEDVFARRQTQSSPNTTTIPPRNPAPHLPHTSSTQTPKTPAIFLPSLGQPSSTRRKHRPLLAKSSRTRSSYTGPVEMIDRSGEGWADSLVDDDSGSDMAASTGYDLASDQESVPTRPTLASSTSSFIRSLPSPSSGAFTQDVRILGWKIVGGRTGRVSSRDVGGQVVDGETEDGHVHVEDQQKPRMGAYVGKSCRNSD